MRAAASPSPADRVVSLSRNCRAAVVEIERLQAEISARIWSVPLLSKADRLAL